MDAQSFPAAIPSPSIPKIAFNLGEAEYSLGVSKRTLNRLIASGEIKSVLVRGCRLIPASELERLCGTNNRDAAAA